MDASRLPSLGPRGEGWVAIQVGLGLAIVLAGPAAGDVWDDAAGLVAAIAGLALIVAGGSLAIRGVLDLGAGLTPFPRPRDGAPLVTHGVYRHARHPIYGGLVLAAAGWGLLFASSLALGLGLALLGFLDLKSRREELWLADRYPGYADYSAHTRRLIPGVY